jgi:4a-hydroxytetrahydrobiopterin dehydratase
MSTPLTKAKIEAALALDAGLPGWSCKREALVKTYKLRSFKEALAWMVRVGFEAEAMNHHPEWTNVYNRVEVKLSTHDAGGRVTAKDVELARRMEAVARTEA